jgi:hypothetical protein
LCPPSLATERTRVLLGSFRKSDGLDAQVYVPAIAAMLANYPSEIVMAATDPVRGIASRQNWLPTLFELRMLCDELMKPFQEAAAREAREQETRKLLAPPLNVATPEERERAVAYYLQRVRPELTTGDTLKPVVETDDEALARVLKRAEAEPLPPLSDVAKGRSHD